MKKRHIVGLIFAVFLAGNQALCASSPSPSALAAAGRLIYASGGGERMFPPVPLADDTSIMADCAANAASNPSKNINCDHVVGEARRAFQQATALRESRKSDILQAAEAAYAAHLSVEDMQTAAAFFESPAGRRLIAAGPAISIEYEAANRNIMMKAALGQGTQK